MASAAKRFLPVYLLAPAPGDWMPRNYQARVATGQGRPSG